MFTKETAMKHTLLILFFVCFILGIHAPPDVCAESAGSGIVFINFFCDCDSGIYENRLVFEFTAKDNKGKTFKHTFDVNRDQSNKINVPRLRDLVLGQLQAQGFDAWKPPKDTPNANGHVQYGTLIIMGLSEIDGSFKNKCMQLKMYVAYSSGAKRENFFPGESKVKDKKAFSIEVDSGAIFRGGQYIFSLTALALQGDDYYFVTAHVEVDLPDGLDSFQTLDMIESYLISSGWFVERHGENEIAILFDPYGREVSGVGLVYIPSEQVIDDIESPHWKLSSFRED